MVQIDDVNGAPVHCYSSVAAILVKRIVNMRQTIIGVMAITSNQSKIQAVDSVRRPRYLAARTILLQTGEESYFLQDG